LRSKSKARKKVKRKPRRRPRAKEFAAPTKTYSAFCVDCGQEIPRPPFMVKANAVDLAIAHTHQTGHANTRIQEREIST